MTRTEAERKIKVTERDGDTVGGKRVQSEVSTCWENLVSQFGCHGAKGEVCMCV